MSSVKALVAEVCDATESTKENVGFLLGLIHAHGIQGRDGSTALIAYLNTPSDQAQGADGLRVRTILQEYQS